MGELLSNLNALELTAAGRWFVVVWMFVFGACIGSFLNVVAYRWPRGQSVVRPPSACPSCGRAIRWHDNLPILGWLVLRGRCRDCRAKISFRYPLVELFVGLATAIVAWANITPVDGPPVPSGTAWFVVGPWRVAWQLVLVYFLLAQALVEFDRQRLRGWHLAVVLFIALVAGPEGLPSHHMLQAGLIGLVLGLLAWPALLNSTDASSVRHAIESVAWTAIIGLFLGQAAVLQIAVVATVLLAARNGLTRFVDGPRRFGWAAALCASTLVWFAVGSHFAGLSTLVAAAIVAGVALAARLWGGSTGN